MIDQKRLKTLAASHRHRAKKFGLTEHFTSKQWELLCLLFDNKCVACGSFDALTPDHVVPLSRNGTNTIDNLQPLCWKCNFKKRTNTADYRNGARLDGTNADILPYVQRTGVGNTPIMHIRFTKTDLAMISEIRSTHNLPSDAAVIRLVIRELSDKLEAQFASANQ